MAATRRALLITAAGGAGLAAVAPAACGASWDRGGAAGAGAASGDVSGEISFLNLGAADEVPIYDQVRDGFQARYPRGTVRIDLTPSGDLPQKVQALMAAGTPPDVFNVSYNEVGTYVAASGLLELERTVQQRAK